MFGFLNGQNDELVGANKQFLSLIMKVLDKEKFENASQKSQILLLDSFVMVLKIFKS